MESLLGHKEQGVVVAYRYASGSISTLQQLFLAVQESIKEALIRKNISYMGENTLKESVISWLEKKPNNDYMTALLQEPKWMAAFSQDSANEIINSLRKSSDVTGLMNNIFALAAEEGITALNITSDSLRSWIVDVIRQNHIKIVLIWDEFSDFFRQNKDSLGEFQKIVAICQEVPFYFVIVTQSFLDETVIHFTEIHDVLSNPLHVFQDIYNPYLTGLTDVECESVKNSIASDLFITSSTQSNAIVKKAAADFKNNQAKTKLFKLWSDKAQGTKNPRDWSRKFRTPILALIPMSQYSEAKKAFDVLNSSFQSENEIEETFCFVEKATFFDDIAQQEYRDEWFAKNVLGDY